MIPTPHPQIARVPLHRHPPTLSERECQLWQDHEWVLHDADVQHSYAGSVVAVSNRTILGKGQTHRAALEAALVRADCPPQERIVTVAVEGHPIQQAPESKERQ